MRTACIPHPPAPEDVQMSPAMHEANERGTLAKFAAHYIHVGLCALPASRKSKRPAIGSWKRFQSNLPAENTWHNWPASANAICVLTGEVSGNLELIDFDFGAELFEAWKQLVSSAALGLFERLVIEQSQSGGCHAFYRCLESEIDGNQKLAQRQLPAVDGNEFNYRGKTVKPRCVKGHWVAEVCLIETRGEGGLVLCDPSPGYRFTQLSFDDLPIVTAEERQLLLDAARTLNEVHRIHRPPATKQNGSGQAQVGRPGDDYGERGEFRDVLRSHGWDYIRTVGENELWRRPGKTGYTWSASLRGKQFYVHSSNATPFVEQTCYSPFAIYAMLEHDCNFKAAAAALRKAGYGAECNGRQLDQWECSPSHVRDTEVLVANMRPSNSSNRKRVHFLQVEPAPPLPQIDPAVYSIPGFVDNLIDFTLNTAPYPNRALAFCGALSLLSVLVGRKVRGPTGLLTNLLVLGLANSGSGKEHPRQINSRILEQVGLGDRLSGRIASGQGLEDVLYEQPTHLFQIDEFDSTLIAINKTNDPIGAEIAARFMELYSASQGTYRTRVKAQGQGEPRRTIVRPHVSLFATCIPSNFYSNLTPKLCSNGMVARLLVIESGERCRGKDAELSPIPHTLIDNAESWRDFNTSGGKYLEPVIVEHDQDAKAIFETARKRAEDQYNECQRASDNAGCSIWARAIEQAHKLAILYACSENHLAPLVREEAAMWATNFSIRQAEWLLHQIGERAGAESKFEELANRVLGRIRLKGGKTSRSDCLKASRVTAREFDELMVTLVKREQISERLMGKTKWVIAR